MNPVGGSWTGRVLSGALLLLLAAWAIQEAVSLIQNVWVGLVVIAAVVAAGLAFWNWWRGRSSGGW